MQGFTRPNTIGAYTKKRENTHCPHCGNLYPRRSPKNDPANRTKDHILPQARGGFDTLYPSVEHGAVRNIRDACQRCNVNRGSCGHCVGAMACVVDIARSKKTTFPVIYRAWSMHVYNSLSSVEKTKPTQSNTTGKKERVIRPMRTPQILEDDIDPPEGALRGLKIVLLNGPPGSGKDTAGSAIVKTLYGGVLAKFARRLKESVHADYGLPTLPHDYFEDFKDKPHPAFFGMTPRAAYILKSENMVKPNLGNGFYGRIFLRDLYTLKKTGKYFAAVTDSGFKEEAEVIAKEVGVENVLLLRIHAADRGKTFAGDSRGYIELDGVRTLSLQNNDKDPLGFCAEAVHTCREWLAG